MLCRKCGREISDNAKFCKKCGAPQVLEVVSEEEYGLMYPKKPYTTNGDELLENLRYNWRSLPIINVITEIVLIVLLYNVPIWYSYGSPFIYIMLGELDFSKKYNYKMIWALNEVKFNLLISLIVVGIVLYIIYAMQIKIISGTPIAPIFSIGIYVWIIKEIFANNHDIGIPELNFEVGLNPGAYFLMLFLILTSALKIYMIIKEKQWREKAKIRHM